jgi:hypothetical protein
MSLLLLPLLLLPLLLLLLLLLPQVCLTCHAPQWQGHALRLCTSSCLAHGLWSLQQQQQQQKEEQ